MAFAPDVAIHLSSPAPKAAIQVIADVTFVTGQSALKDMSVKFPKAFGFNEKFRPARCQPVDEAAQTCPASSQVGTVGATSVVGPATGAVYITQDFRLVAFASALGGLIKVTAAGAISVTKAGGFAVTFTGLPNLPLNTLNLSLTNPLLKNPKRCKVYKLPVHGTAFSDETFDTSVSAPVTGCAR